MDTTRSEPRIDRASRLINADASIIYRAFIDADALAAWLPPSGMRGRVDALDPRPGGSFAITLTYVESGNAAPGKTSDDTDTMSGRFVDLEENTRIVWDIEFASDDPAFAGTMRMNWSFTAVPDGTLVAIAAENVPVGISPEDHDTGLRSSLENLAAFAEQRSR